MIKVSMASKSIVGAIVTLAGAAAAAFGPATTIGKWAVIVGAFATAIVTIYQTKNTQVVSTGDTNGPVSVGKVLSDSGAVVGEITADTGALTGGVIAGTTGILGGILDNTVGKLLPKDAAAKHAA